MNQSPSLIEITLYFLGLSLLAIGGANAVIPDLHRHLVEVRGWMSGSEFVALTALSQAAPGPNILIVTLLGWKLAGLAGALAATAAMCIPSGLLTFFVARQWRRYEQAPWRAILKNGLAPVTVGLILASGYVLARVADHTIGAWLVTAATVTLLLVTRINPLWLLAAGAVLGYAGLV
jgi:chromate transporter